MRKHLFMFLACLALVAACANPRLTYVTAEESFKSGVAFVNTTIENGDTTLEQAEKLEPWIDGGNFALGAWLDLILATPEGEKPDIPAWIYRNIQDAIDVIEAYVLKKKKGVTQ